MLYYDFPIEKIKTKKLADDLRHKLSEKLTEFFLKEWGGNRNPLIIAFANQELVPQLIKCLELNQDFIYNATFEKIFANKFYYEFGYSQSFAITMGHSLLNLAQHFLQGNVPANQQNSHLWKPWQRILRMLTIGESVKIIAKKTGYSESYLELLRKCKNSSSHYDHHDSDYLSCVADFNYKLKNEEDFLEYLFCEQIIEDLQLEINTKDLFSIFLVISDFSGQLSINDLTDSNLNFGSFPTGQVQDRLSNLPVVLKSLPPLKLKQVIQWLIESRWLILDKNKLRPSPKIEKLTARKLGLIYWEYTRKLLEEGKTRELHKILQALNNEVLFHVADYLINFQPGYLKKFLDNLPIKNNRGIYLKALELATHINRSEAIEFCLRALENNDQLIVAKAIETLGQLEALEAYFVLLKQLNAQSLFVREKALTTLFFLKGPNMAKRLEEILAKPDEEYQLKIIARDLLKQLKEEAGQ